MLLSILSFAAKKPIPAADPDYILALSAADHFLQAWQTGDYESGLVMLTDAAKQNLSETQMDEFFASEIADAGNVVLATEGALLPTELFATNAVAIGNIASRNDYGVLRRVRAFGSRDPG